MIGENMKNFLTNYLVLISSVALNIPSHVFGNDLCDTSHLFAPKWNTASGTCMLGMDIKSPKKQSDKQHNIFFDFDKKNIFVGSNYRSQSKMTNPEWPEYSFFSSYSFLTFTKGNSRSNIATNYTYTWDINSKKYIQRGHDTKLHAYLNVFPTGTTSLTKNIPDIIKDDNMVSISEEINTCNKIRKSYLVVKVNGVTQYLIDPSYSHSTDLSKITDEKKCNTLAEDKASEVAKPLAPPLR
jgi:hypothetical protein